MSHVTMTQGVVKIVYAEDKDLPAGPYMMMVGQHQIDAHIPKTMLVGDFPTFFQVKAAEAATQTTSGLNGPVKVSLKYKLRSMFWKGMQLTQEQAVKTFEAAGIQSGDQISINFVVTMKAGCQIL